MRRAAASAPTFPPSRSAKLVDTTGAGDLFAAGFLLGEARGQGLEQSLRLGAIAAAEVIQHYGARPEADLRALAGELTRLVVAVLRRNRSARHRRDADRRRRIRRKLRHFDDAAADMAAAARIAEVDQQADGAPDRQDQQSRSAAASTIERDAADDRERRDNADSRRAERPRAARIGAAQHQHRDRHHHEGEQRARVRIVGQLADRQEGRRQRHADAGDGGDDVRRAEARVDGRELAPEAGRRGP